MRYSIGVIDANVDSIRKNRKFCIYAAITVETTVMGCGLQKAQKVQYVGERLSHVLKTVALDDQGVIYKTTFVGVAP